MNILESTDKKQKESNMLKWSVVFFIVAIVAAALGFTGIAASATEIAKVLFYVFLVLFLVSLLLGVTLFR